MTIAVKVPGINGLGKTNGCENSGEKILKILKEEIYSNEQGKIIGDANLNIEEINLDNSNLKSVNELIYDTAFEIIKKNQKAIFLGGDHSISYSLTRAFFDYCQNLESVKEPCLIVFDAHSDCMHPFKEDDGKVIPTHEEWLRALVEDGFPPQNILLVGVRNSYSDEIRFLKEKNIKVILMNQLLENLEDSCDIIMEFSNNRELYVSIDIDVIDPVFAPSTGYTEPGGLTSREFIYLIQRINKIRNLKSIDIVEINSEKDKENNGLTLKLGAKILSELI